MSPKSVIFGGFAFIGILASVAFVTVFVNTYFDRRRRRQEYEAILKRYENRPRGRIVKIGTVVRDELGQERAFGFCVDCEGKAPGMSMGHNGEWLFAGWTDRELCEIAKRRSEFEP